MRTVSILFAILCLARAPALAAPGPDRSTEALKMSNKELTGLLDFSPRTVYYGGCMISEGDTLEGAIVVIAGSLDIQDGAALRGTAWIINGRLIMTGSSVLDGDVNLVNAGEFLSNEAAVTGKINRYRCECRLNDELFEREGTVEFIRFEDPKAVKTRFALGGDKAGRVDYSLIGIGVKRENKDHREPYVRWHAWISPSLMKKSTGRIGFDVEAWIPLDGNRLQLIAHGFKRTFTNDNWMMSDIENGGIVLLTGDDFFDYWEKRGFELGLKSAMGERLALETRMSYQRDVSMEAHELSSILFPRDKYRENPAIDAGARTAFSGRLTYDSRGEEAWRENAWLVDLWLEKGVADGPGDFSYTVFEADARRYNYLPWKMKFDLRSRIFSSFTAIPLQLTRSLNGYSGVRGTSDFPFEVQRAGRMALLSAELRRRLPDLPVFRWIYTGWDFVIFSDMGLLTSEENMESPFAFLDAPFAKWKKTAGIGFSGESFLPCVGFYVAQDLDADDFNPRFILRIQRSF